VFPDFKALVHALCDASVDFVVVGGIALVLRGSPRITRDLGICYSRTPDNLDRLARALAPLAPRLRGAPTDLPFTLDAATLKSGLNFTLTSASGDIDLLGELTGLGQFPEVKRLSSAMPVYGRSVDVLDLDGLERAKRAAGRLKDVADLAEILEIRRIREEADR
jgi:hypothetical protein